MYMMLLAAGLRVGVLAAQVSFSAEAVCGGVRSGGDGFAMASCEGTLPGHTQARASIFYNLQTLTLAMEAAASGTLDSARANASATGSLTVTLPDFLVTGTCNGVPCLLHPPHRITIPYSASGCASRLETATSTVSFGSRSLTPALPDCISSVLTWDGTLVEVDASTFPLLIPLDLRVAASGFGGRNAGGGRATLAVDFSGLRAIRYDGVDVSASAVVEVNLIPEPNTAWFLFAGLAFLAIRRFRYNRES